jgi:hypothetical protein
MCCLVLDS